MNSEDEIFQVAISLWPSEIDTTDKIIHENGGASIPYLTDVHNAVEEKVLGYEDNYFLRQMDWAIYTILHKAARELDLVCPNKINREDVFKVYRENIED